MTRISLVVSDVDGTLVTSEKLLTDKAQQAARRLHEAGIGFTITSARPPVGLRFLPQPLGITLPIGPFNGSSIVKPDLSPLVQHFIPASAVQKSLDLFAREKIDAWLFTNDKWLIHRDDGKYVPHERDTIRHKADLTSDFSPYLATCCKIVGVSGDEPLLARAETELQQQLGDQATAIRSQSYYLDVTPPGQNKGTFVTAMTKRLGISADAVATIGDMQNDLAMFRVSGMSIAMGNATDEVKQQATNVTTSNENEGFASAIDLILARNAAAD